MKKKIQILAMGAMLLFAAQAKASLVDATVFGGFTTLGMGDLNDQIDAMTAGAPSALKVTKMTSGYYVGVDALFTVAPFIKVGPRLEYIGAGQAKIDATALGAGSITFDGGLLPIEVGISSDVALPMAGVSVNGGLWAGYGFGSASMDSTIPGVGVGGVKGSGGGFVGEINAGISYSPAPIVNIGLDLGYRLAKISSMKVDSSSGDMAGSTGNFTKINNEDMTFDFSGMNIGGAVTFKF